jgi:low affinity Fe/Cu permease
MRSFLNACSCEHWYIAIVQRRGAKDMKEVFRRLAEKTAHAVGSYWAFLIALLTIVVWALTGPYFNYSDTWQLFINTGTTIVTFLMVFLIQNTQNRETRIVALKLDELLRGVEGARTGLVELDHMSDDDLELVRQEFARLRDKYAPLVDDDLAHVERELKARKRRR